MVLPTSPFEIITPITCRSGQYEHIRPLRSVLVAVNERYGHLRPFAYLRFKHQIAVADDVSLQRRRVALVGIQKFVVRRESGLFGIVRIHRMAGAAVGHIDQTDEYSPLVASHRGIFVPYPQRRGPCIEIERPPHIDRTAHTGNGAERPHEEIARSQLADTEETRLLGLQFCGKTPLRTGPGVLHTRRQVVLLARRGGAGIAVPQNSVPPAA